MAGHGPSIGLPAGLPEPPNWWKEGDTEALRPPSKRRISRVQGKQPTTRGPYHHGEARPAIQATTPPSRKERAQLPREAPPPENTLRDSPRAQVTSPAILTLTRKTPSSPTHRNRTTRYMAAERAQESPRPAPTRPPAQPNNPPPPTRSEPASCERRAEEKQPEAHTAKELTKVRR
ncbi:uncharacterized protein LOC143208465 [Lasioglossum baleicum]|uniref:uncharacterized protein LOC143208465 n=1 Tax=Lasioglossum baleicum TaxID=434251 RepID=UPI003FCE4C51